MPTATLTVGCYLYDVALQQRAGARRAWSCRRADWRRAAHKCADLVYSRLSGESPFFDSRIAYIAETGPKDRRIKRLAIMDSDGANHRFLTNGQSTALTPRYSPDYKQIVYLSYLGTASRGSIVYDIGSGRQRLVTESAQPDFRAALVARRAFDPLFDGGRRQYRHLPRLGRAAAHAAAADQHARASTSAAAISPDGRKIVFESDRSGSQQIYVMNADGSDQRRISFFGGRCGDARMEPARRPDRLHPHRRQLPRSR